MIVPDLLREAVRALRASRTRTVLTALGVTVGTMALTLILSLSLGLSRVIDDLVASDEQIRHVIAAPGFGRQASDGRSTPQVEGEMSEEKRQRLQRALLKRSRGGPPFQVRTRVIDDATERELAAMDGVADAQAFLQDRFEVAFADAGATAAAAPQVALSIASPAKHGYYPGRVIAGRWFTSDTERGVVLHEVLLWKLGFTSDAAQKDVVGRSVKLTARRSAPGLAQFFGMGSAPNAPVLYEEVVPVVGVLRERFGDERATFVEEAFAMQADVFLPQGFARELWERQPGRSGPPAILLVARTVDDVAKIETALEERGLEARSVRKGVEGIQRSLSIVTVIAAALAGIAVFVSALGIVNTLVMSVVERTREIGLLKALGATRSDVRNAFLAEAALLSGVGGATGIAVAVSLGALVRLALPAVPFATPPAYAAAALGTAVAVGLVAGVRPARRAAALDPVENLRAE